jgi:hypothetical protein
VKNAPPALFVLSLSLAACASREHRETTIVAQPQSTEPVDAAAAIDAALSAAQAPLDSGLAGAGTDAAARPSAYASTQRRPLYYDRDLTDADLSGRTLRELALLRNSPYARLGHRFRRPWLSQYFAGQEWYRPQRQVADADLSERDRRNAQAAGRFDTALSREALEELARALRVRAETDALLEGDDVEAQLLSQRLGRSITLANRAPRSSTPLDDPAQLDNVLNRAALLDMSPRDLWILRNMIYARRGRPFRSSILLEYFDSTDWYQPDQAYNDARLRRVDRQNLRMIQSVEAEVGGPTNAASEAEMAMYGA